MQEDEYITIDLQEVLNLLLKKIHWILLSAVLVGAVGFVINWYVLKPNYQADAMIIVNTREEQNVVVTNDQINSARQLVNTYEVILKSDTVMEQVLNALVNRGLASYENMSVNKLKKSIKVSPVNSTQVMQVSATSPDPEQALAMVDEVLTIAPSIIIRTVKAGSVEVVSYPKLEDAPVSPKKIRNLALCLFGGAAAAAGVIILQELLDNTVKTDEDIREKLGFPVLGVIPKIRESDLSEKNSERRKKIETEERKELQNG
ncbi:MAG: hypothetical protein IJI07_11405 [Flexilinea sp.]|nr:hypothetical protein [Flexilinea sp.]